MKLLLDAHHSPRVAHMLRDAGYDVVAALDSEALARLTDDELLRVAATEGRVLVTEDVADFARLARQWAQSGEHHAGIVFTSARRYHRGSKAYRTQLVRALTKLLEVTPSDQPDAIWWL